MEIGPRGAVCFKARLLSALPADTISHRTCCIFFQALGKANYQKPVVSRIRTGTIDLLTMREKAQVINNKGFVLLLNKTFHTFLMQ